eukprot:2002829-Rhodomonas_salina.1
MGGGGEAGPWETARRLPAGKRARRRAKAAVYRAAQASCPPHSHANPSPAPPDGAERVRGATCDSGY